MKNFLFAFAIVSFFSCKKEIGPGHPDQISAASAAPLLALSKVSVANQPYEPTYHYEKGRLKTVVSGSQVTVYEYDDVNGVTSVILNGKVYRKFYYNTEKKLVKEELFQGTSYQSDLYTYENDRVKMVVSEQKYLSNRNVAIQTFNYLNNKLSSIKREFTNYQNNIVVKTQTFTDFYKWHNPYNFSINEDVTYTYSPAIKSPDYNLAYSVTAASFNTGEFKVPLPKFLNSVGIKRMLMTKVEGANGYLFTLENIVSNHFGFPIEFDQVSRSNGNVISTKIRFTYIDLNKTY